MRKKSILCSSQAPQVSLYEYFITIELAVWPWLRNRQTDRQSYFRIYNIGMDFILSNLFSLNIDSQTKKLLSAVYFSWVFRVVKAKQLAVYVRLIFHSGQRVNYIYYIKILLFIYYVLKWYWNVDKAHLLWWSKLEIYIDF